MIKSRDYSVLFPISFSEFWRMTRYIHFADNGCWIWTGPLYASGYGKVRLRKAFWAVHRLFFEMFRGHVPEGYPEPIPVGLVSGVASAHGPDARNSRRWLIQR